MKYRVLLFFLVFFSTLIALTCIPVLFRNLTASGRADTLNIENQNSRIIRVGISTNDFSKYEYNQIKLTSDDKFSVFDKNNDSPVATFNAGEVLTLKINNGSFELYGDDRNIAENITDTVCIKPENNATVKIIGLKRAGKPACYRGEIEIPKASASSNKFFVINKLPLEDYLKGVVPNELPVSFGYEALKAQAIAARNYAIRPRVYINKQYDVCDSVDCQVYFGYNSENNIANRAIEETSGLAALYNGNPIVALYSSSSGGYTENYENAFSEPKSGIFPANPVPYLKGKPDVDNIPILDSDENAKWFYSASIPTFDINSGYYRWNKTWTREELEAVLNKNLAKYSFSPFISPQPEKNIHIGTLNKIEVLERGVSGKAMIVRISSDNGEWTIKKELLIRRIFENSGRILPSANVIFDNIADSAGNLTGISAKGWGYGHGVGMSQYGAGYMSRNGYTFDQILKHYYDGIAIGTIPVAITADDSQPQVKQDFSVPEGKATLVLDNPEGLDSFKIGLNSRKFVIPLDKFDRKTVRVSLDDYIIRGANEIVYYPLKESNGQKNPEGKNIRAWIEVYPKDSGI